MDVLDAIDRPGVTAWFEEHIPGSRPPLSFTLIAGGHSNMTFKVTDKAGQDFVLRRPPMAHVLPTAHDMGREFTIISALGPTAVPVPPALGYCADAAVTGAPFYIMGYVAGHIFHDVSVALQALPTEDLRRRCGQHFIDVLADLHAVDVDAVGLGQLARKEGYIARQLKRWYSQWTQSKTRELPVVDRVHDELLDRIPEQGPASVVHGDYRLGNCITGDDGLIAAVLDWEICTLGDPLADVGYVLSHWTHPSDESTTTSPSPSMAPGFPRREEMLERYSARAGRDLSGIDFFIAFSYWKSACIVEGVYARYLGGALGDARPNIESFHNQVERAALMAEAALSRLA